MLKRVGVRNSDAQVIWFAFMWSIWKSRNELIFYAKKNISVEDVLLSSEC